jgi:Tfp pilus assembly protein PilF
MTTEIDINQGRPVLPPPTTAAAWLERAVWLLGQGDAAAAARAASEACRRAPQDARAHYVYGQAWLALGEHGRAALASGAAIRLAPDWADAWVNYGLAHYRQGDIETAKEAMRQALRRVPRHAAATANLGAFMRISGEFEEAEALLTATLARSPEDVGARLNLVADLLQEDRAAEALILLEAPVPADPAIARHWHLQRALGLIELGRAAEARVALAAITDLGPIPRAVAPLWYWRHALLARAEGDAAGMRTSAAQMAAALEAMGPDATPEHRIMGHYDLAKLYSESGDAAAAMRHWAAGHALLRPTQPFSRAAHAAFIDASIEAFGGARLRAGARAANSDPAPVFIVGMPRSGTTLCEQILGAHRDVQGAGERTALSEAFAALGKGRDAAAARRVAASDGATLDAAATDYLAGLHALAPDRARIVDKMPGNYLYLGLVGLLLPGARIIHCMRDPRDIGLSIFTIRFYGYHPYAHDLADLGWTIAEQLRLMAHWRAVLPNPILTVRLSDWVTDFDATLAAVLAHLGLPPDPACARFYESTSRVRTMSRAQVRRPVNAGGLGRWHRYATDLAPLIAALDEAGALEGWKTAAPDMEGPGAKLTTG